MNVMLGRNALMCGTVRNSIACVELLLERGANVNAIDTDGII